VNRLIDLIALDVAERLRLGSCQHGLPDQVAVSSPPEWEGHVARPLCDACVMAAVRHAFEEPGVFVRRRMG
jgi:hypothetical protein